MFSNIKNNLSKIIFKLIETSVSIKSRMINIEQSMWLVVFSFFYVILCRGGNELLSQNKK